MVDAQSDCEKKMSSKWQMMLNSTAALTLGNCFTVHNAFHSDRGKNIIGTFIILDKWIRDVLFG